jgi:hypothetical protein
LPGADGADGADGFSGVTGAESCRGVDLGAAGAPEGLGLSYRTVSVGVPF